MRSDVPRVMPVFVVLCDKCARLQVLTAVVQLVVMVMLTAHCRHDNVMTSARSAHLTVANGNVSVSETVAEKSRANRQTGTDCRAMPHDVLWRRVDVGMHSSAEQIEDDETDENVGLPLVARRTCTPLTHDHRRHRRRLRRRTAAHLCRMEKCRLRMRDDVFPPYVDGGRCVGLRTCLFGLYECVPRRRVVKLLRRLTPSEASRCLPPSSVASDAVLENVWVPLDLQLTVACDCARRRVSGIYAN